MRSGPLLTVSSGLVVALVVATVLRDGTQNHASQSDTMIGSPDPAAGIGFAEEPSSHAVRTKEKIDTSSHSEIRGVANAPTGATASLRAQTGKVHADPAHPGSRVHANALGTPAEGSNGDAIFPQDAENRILQALADHPQWRFTSINRVTCKPTLCEIRYTGGPDLSHSVPHDALLLALTAALPMVRSATTSSRIEVSPGIYVSSLTVRTYRGSESLED